MNVINQHPEIAERLVALIAESNHTMKLFRTGRGNGMNLRKAKFQVVPPPAASMSDMQNMGASVTIEWMAVKNEFLMTLGYACGGNASVALLVNGEKQTDLLPDSLSHIFRKWKNLLDQKYLLGCRWIRNSWI